MFLSGQKKEKNAILFYGMLRNYQVPYHSISNVILKNQDTDVFYFGPKETDLPDKRYSIGIQDKDGFFIKNPKEESQKTTPVDQKEFIDTYKPYLKKYFFHDHSTDFFEDLSTSLRDREDWLMGLNPARMLSMFYNMNGVINLFKEFSKKSKVKYNKIIITRTDIVTYTNFPCFISPGQVHIPCGEGFSNNGEKHIGNASVFFYKNMYTGDYVPGGRRESFNDQIMILDYSDLERITNLYDDVLHLIKNSVPLSPETILYIIYKRNNFDIIAHDEWSYEIYRDGKDHITSVMNIEDLINIDRYNPRLTGNNNKTKEIIPIEKFYDRKIHDNVIGYINRKLSTRKGIKFKNDIFKFYSDSNSYFNFLPKKLFNYSLKSCKTHVFWGKDGKIKSDCGKILNDTLCISADRDCFALYGPFITLNPGVYIGKISFKSPINAESVIVDVVSDELGTIFRENYSTHNEYDKICIDLSWEINEKTSNVEVRTFVNKGFIAQFDYLVIRKIS